MYVRAILSLCCSLPEIGRSRSAILVAAIGSKNPEYGLDFYSCETLV
jgi:hypothetical protein